MSDNAKLRAVLDQVAAGRTKNLTCPFCDQGTLKVEPGDYGPELVVSKPEGRGNLYDDPRLTAWAGVGALWLKHEGENPTGSFKDRGMTVGMTHARWLGARTVAWCC